MYICVRCDTVEKVELDFKIGYTPESSDNPPLVSSPTISLDLPDSQSGSELSEWALRRRIGPEGRKDSRTVMKEKQDTVRRWFSLDKRSLSLLLHLLPVFRFSLRGLSLLM